jgi:hypothetical protein
MCILYTWWYCHSVYCSICLAVIVCVDLVDGESRLVHIMILLVAQSVNCMYTSSDFTEGRVTGVEAPLEEILYSL